MSYRRFNVNIFGAIIVAAFCAIILISCGSSGEEAKVSTMREFVPDEIMGWKAQPGDEEYDRETIFDYINGAGEVYLSYGFQNVTVSRFARDGQPEISVEVFDMNKAEDAYGVFSHSRDSEEQGIGGGYEYRGSLLCFWKGQYFICVRADQDTPEAAEAIMALSKAIDGNISSTGSKPMVVALLPEPNLSRGSVRFFHGHASMNYHYFLAEENVLHLDQSTNAVIGQYNPGSVYLLCIQYPSTDMSKAGYDGFISGYIPDANENGAARLENGKWAVAKLVDNYVIVVFDVKHEMAGSTLLKDCEEKIMSSIS